jgi:hypothetical protein
MYGVLKIRNWQFTRSVGFKKLRSCGTRRWYNLEITSSSQNNWTPLCDTTLPSCVILFFPPSLFYLFFVIPSSSFSVRSSLLPYHICRIFSCPRKFSEQSHNSGHVDSAHVFISPMISDVSARIAAVFFLVTGPLVTSHVPVESEEASRLRERERQRERERDRLNRNALQLSANT